MPRGTEKDKPAELTEKQQAGRKFAKAHWRKNNRHFHPDIYLSEKEMLEMTKRENGAFPKGYITKPGLHRPEDISPKEWRWQKYLELQDQYPASGHGTKQFEEYNKPVANKIGVEICKEKEDRMQRWQENHPGWCKVMGVWSPPESDIESAEVPPAGSRNVDDIWNSIGNF